jgi:hypothetical protein
MLLQICLNCSVRHLAAIDTIAASLFQLSDDGFPLSAICSGNPMEIDKSDFLSKAAENVFLQFRR